MSNNEKSHNLISGSNACVWFQRERLQKNGAKISVNKFGKRNIDPKLAFPNSWREGNRHSGHK